MKLVLISGGSGVGKSTIAKRITEKHHNVTEAISYTTREKRAGESEADYHFVSAEEIFKLHGDGMVLRPRNIFGNLYASPDLFSFVNYEVALHIVKSQYAVEIRNLYPNCTCVWLDAPVKILKERLKLRNLEPADMEMRLNSVFMEREVAISNNFDVVENKVFKDTVKSVENIIFNKAVDV